MTNSKALLAHWGSLGDADLSATVQTARRCVQHFAAVTQVKGSLTQSWIQGQEVLEFEHYPSDDVVDRRRGSQFYYHAHRDGELEHGHLHLFWHAAASGRRRYLKPGSTPWKRAAPTHLYAISLDPRGMPVALFTVNRWVTDGYWFDAQTTLACADRFAPADVPEHELSCAWLTSFNRLYRPLVAELLAMRDARLAQEGELDTALDDRDLEVLSFFTIDWGADLDALEGLALSRGLNL